MQEAVSVSRGVERLQFSGLLEPVEAVLLLEGPLDRLVDDAVKHKPAEVRRILGQVGDGEGVVRKIYEEAGPLTREGGAEVISNVVLALFGHQQVGGGDATRQFESGCRRLVMMALRVVGAAMLAGARCIG